MISPILQTAVFVRSADRTQVLLMHRNKWSQDIHFGKYLSLGGHVEPDEDVLTCARREVNEESGLTASDLTLRGTVMWTGFGHHRINALCFIFRCDVFAGTPHNGNEEGTLEWVPMDKLASRPIWESDRLWLPMVFDTNTKPFYGVMPYDGHEMLSWSFQR
ncbi:NUDIX hydrolase [Catellatospora chokoriensis]|uniref:NUDIX hydrolase n=1 Tax=Catellatospora chokoriensis TaxID=310353 RepID=UPI001941061B|nr:8-oxo-dGTP diphosphatase [Catellatospora chokoriensis]